MSETDTDFAAWLRSELARTGLSQSRVARAVETQQTQVSLWSLGKRQPQRRTERELHAFFAAQPDASGLRWPRKGEASRRAFTETFGPLTAENLLTVVRDIGGIERLAYELIVPGDTVRHWCKRLGISVTGWGRLARYEWGEQKRRGLTSVTQ